MPSDDASSWTQEVPSVRWLERSILAGANIGFVAYGVVATIYFLCLSHLLAGPRRARKRDIWLLTYITLVFILSSVLNGINMRLDQLAYIDHRDYPGGPDIYKLAESGITVNLVGTAVVYAITWLQDGLLLYRFFIIWGSNVRILALPLGLFLGSVALSCILIFKLSLPGASLWDAINKDYALAYWSTSVATNVLLTVLIAGRLAQMRRKVARTMGKAAAARSPYLSVSAMLVESAALYSAVAVPFMITYARGDIVNFIFSALLGQVQAIAPLLIVLRVAQGRAWSQSANLDTQTQTFTRLSGSTGRATRLDLAPGRDEETLERKLVGSYAAEQSGIGQAL